MYPGKRIFDILFSAFLLVILLPLFILIAIIIKIDNMGRGPVFYKAKRIGLCGKEFEMLKFRSMIEGADLDGPTITISGDTRITKIGSFLRKSKLDELPSFINVLKGDMSVVGPRPECPDWVAKYSDEERKILFIKPGITGPAQIEYKNEEKLLSGKNWQSQYLHIMRDKLSIDLQYYTSNSLLQDLTIILRTIS
jgi:lipopolysaccharide/colanic/teichoic acid biosynthesis glycosyltransferase